MIAADARQAAYIKHLLDEAPPLPITVRALLVRDFAKTRTWRQSMSDAATRRAQARAAYIQRVVDEAPPPPDELVALAARAFLTEPKVWSRSMALNSKTRAAIDTYLAEVASVEVQGWAPLTATQRDLLRRAFHDRSAAAPSGAPQPVEPRPEPRVALYRHFDADDVLLYVGISENPVLRTRSHARRAQWREFATRSEMEWHDNRKAAQEAEVAAIRAEEPLFNSMMAGPQRDQRLVAYLVKHDRLDLLSPAPAS